TQKASGPNATTGVGGVNARQIGLGVKMGAINTNISQQGATQTTNNPFDIQITGEAFFIVNNGSENYFTRDGSFYVDGAGNLCMTSNGYMVMGWGVDPNDPTQILPGDVQSLQIMNAQNMSYDPEATTLGYVSGILDKNEPAVNSTSGKTVNLQLYDALGYLYTAKLNMKSTDEEGVFGLELTNIMDSNNQAVSLDGLNFGTTTQLLRTRELNLANGYSWAGTTLNAPGGATHTIDADVIDADIADVDLTPDQLAARQALIAAYGLNSISDIGNLSVIYKYVDAGNQLEAEVPLESIILNSPVAGITGITNARDIYNPNPDLAKITTGIEYIQGYTVEYDPTTGKFAGINGNADTITLALASLTTPPNTPDGPSRFENIQVDFTTTNMFNNSGTSTLTATNGDFKGIGSGRKTGKMIGVSVDTSGRIYASYDNGQTRLLGQIAVAEFANASGLEKAGDNLYSDTLNSGEFNGIGVDITANGGYMNTGVLEMSNVDLSAEFTEMITTQRGFQANSRIITVSDTMLEELVNLKR
ncbi:MAG: flagellar hook-basal body complex protein, partial [Lachnospiraceae bacterium]|nr:flagellar hook-basal body complex protein [Lachnospiraceae bacterium]